ncbi:MAG: ATP-binding cassette domain-containing protein [Thermoanaerobaculum sp.]
MPDTVLEGRNLVLAFVGRGRHAGLAPPLEGPPREGRIVALAGVSLAVARGEVVGVVGASGAGKSSLVRVLACLLKPDAGEVYWRGMRVDDLPEAKRRPWRHLVQVVFQEPGSSFNPRLSVGFGLREALNQGRKARANSEKSPGPERDPMAAIWGAKSDQDAIRSLFAVVGLDFSPPLLERRIFEFSGGQRQRLSLARALAAAPEVLLLDEPVASLDVPVRHRFLDTLREAVSRAGLAVVLVTHDLAVLEGLARRVLVLLSGRVVEEGLWEQVRKAPLHPYTWALLEASRTVPRGQRFFQLGASGCPFRLACPRASAACTADPPLEGEGERRVACFHPLSGNISNEKLVERQREGG